MGWYNSSWTYRVKLEVPSTQVTGTHSNFPIPIDLSNTKFDNLKSLLSSNALSNGDDILFTDSDGTTKLDHEIEEYDNVTGKLIAWVKIPSGIADSANKEFYIYFGNSGASNQENTTGVWSNSFAFVSHDGGITDSTSNANSTTNNGTTSITGKIGDGRNFDGTDDYISITDDTSIQFTSNFSISLLFKSDELIDSTRVSSGQIALFNRENDWLLRWFSSDSGKLRFGTFGGNIQSVKNTWSADTWFHLGISIADPTASIRMLIDGSVDSTGTGDAITITDPKNIILGSTQDGLDSFFDGIFDEVRIHSTNRSDDWFATESSALKDATNFINVLEVTTYNATNITSSSSTLNAYQNIDNAIEKGFLYDTTSRDTPVGDTDNILDTESFETSLGDWTNDVGNVSNWIRNSGSTPSSDTGASSAQDGSWYIYVETSSGDSNSNGDTDIIEYDMGSTKDGYVDFYYHQYGTDQGTLYLEGWDGTWNTIWSSTGNQGDQWNQIQSPTTDFTGYSKLRFRNVASGGVRGDVCLDLIEVHETTSQTLPDGDYSNKIFETTHSNATPPSYYDNNWTEVDEISIQSSQVTGTHTDYKLLIDLSDSKFQILKNNLQSYAQSTGNDILFTDDDGTTKLDHEIEEYDSSTGNLIAWVRIPSGVNSTTDKSIYMYYGNSGATNQENATGVWGNNTYGIYHLNGDFNDSSSNGNNATNNGTTSAVGKISNGRSFDGTDDHISFGNLFEDPPFTLYGWIYSTDFTSGSFNINTVFSKESSTVQSFGVRIGDSGIADNRLQFIVRQSDGTEFRINGTLLNSSEWYHVVATYDTDGSMVLYLNGSSDGTNTADGTTQATSTVDILAGEMDNVREFTGNMDEIRLLNEVIDSNTVATEYANQNSPETFISWVNEPADFSAGTYSEQLTGLTEGERYYFRAYAYDGTTYYFGEELNFSTIVNPDNTSHTFSPDLAGYVTTGTIEYIASSIVEETPFTESSSWTHSHTLPTGGGDSRKLLVNVHVNEAGDDLVDVTAISYGGINILANQLEENNGTGAFYPNTTTFEILESDLSSLTEGNSYDLDVTLSLGRDGATSIVLIKDAEQTTSESSQGTSFSTAVSTNITTANSSDYILVDFITGAFDTTLNSADGSQTVLYNEDNSANHQRPYGSSYKEVSGASTYSMEWTLNADRRWMQNIIGVEELQSETILIVPIYDTSHNTTSEKASVTSTVDSTSHSHTADNSLTENPVNDSSHVHTSENAPTSSSPSDSEHVHTSENTGVTSSVNETTHTHTVDDISVTISPDETTHTLTSDNSTVTSSVDETEHSHNVDNSFVTSSVDETSHSHTVDNSTVTSTSDETSHTHTADNSSVTSSVNETEHSHNVDNSTVTSTSEETSHTLTSDNSSVTSSVEETTHPHTVDNTSVTISPEETNHTLTSDNSTVTSAVNDSEHINNTEISISLSVAEDTSHSHTVSDSTVTSTSSDTQHTLTSENTPVTSVIEDSEHIQTVDNVNVLISPEDSEHIHTSENGFVTSSVNETEHSHNVDNSIVTSTSDDSNHNLTSDNSIVTSSVNETEHSHNVDSVTVTIAPEETSHALTSDNSTVTSSVDETEHSHTADVSISEQLADRSTHVHTAEKASVTSTVNDSSHNHLTEQARDITRIDDSEHSHTSDNSFVLSETNDSTHTHSSDNSTITSAVDETTHNNVTDNSFVTSSVDETEHIHTAEDTKIVTNIQESTHIHTSDNSIVTSLVENSDHIQTVDNTSVTISPEETSHALTSDNSTVTSSVDDSTSTMSSDISISLSSAEDTTHILTSESPTVTSIVNDSTHVNNTDGAFVGTEIDETTHTLTSDNSTVTSGVDETNHTLTSDNSTVTSAVNDSEHINATESSTSLVSASSGNHIQTSDNSTVTSASDETTHIHTSENISVTSSVNDSTSLMQSDNSTVTSSVEDSIHSNFTDNSTVLSIANETAHILTSDSSLTELPVDESSHVHTTDNAFVTSSADSISHTLTSDEAIDLISTEDTSHSHTVDSVAVTVLVHDTLHGHLGGYQTEEEVISERFIRMLEIEYDVSDERNSLISSIIKENDERLSTWERYPPLTTHTMYLSLQKVRDWDTEIRIRQTVVELGDVVINIEPPTVVDYDVITNTFLEFDGGDIDYFRKGDTDTDVLLFTKRPNENRVDLQVSHKYMHYHTDYSTDVQGTAFAKGEEAKPLHPYSLENITLVNQFILIKLNPSATLFTNDNTEYIMVKKKSVEELKTEVENENASLLDNMIILTPNKSKYVFNDIYEKLIDESYTINMWTPDEIPSDHKTVLDNIRREEKYKSKWILLYRDISDNPLVEVVK